MSKPSDIILAKIQRMGGSKDDAITSIIEYLDETAKEKECAGQNQLEKYKDSGLHTNIMFISSNGEWCQACGAWKQYGTADVHHCTGYKITC